MSRRSFNHRKDINDADCFSLAISGIVGRRLMYNDDRFQERPDGS